MSRDSSPLFCRSSPPPHLSGAPEDAVATLLERAQRVQTLSPAVDDFLKSNQSAFFGLFSRQIELIKSRSQNFRDAEVTVFDKTLLTLTEQQPNCLMNPAAIRFYCEEYLNINLGGPVSEMTLTLRETAQIPEVLKQAFPSSNTTTTAVEPEADRRTKQSSRLAPLNVDLRKDMEPKLAALWSVYETARTDYLAALEKNSREKTISTAKFLRDTAENIILFLENKNADALMVAELEGTFTHAKTTVVCLTGGKNRKFDKAEVDKVMGVPRGPSRPTHSHQSQYPYPSSITSRFGSGATVTNAPFSSDRYTEYDSRGGAPYAKPPPRRDLSPYACQPTHDGRHNNSNERSSYAGTAPEPVRQYQYSDFGNHPRQQKRQLSPDVEFRRGSDSRREDRSASPEPSGRDVGREPSRDYYRPQLSKSRSSDDRRYRPSYRNRAGEDRDSLEEETGTNRGRAAANTGRAKVPMHGRGHSGIPYGYDGQRKVDSYRPSRGRDQDDDDAMDDDDDDEV